MAAVVWLYLVAVTVAVAVAVAATVAVTVAVFVWLWLYMCGDSVLGWLVTVYHDTHREEEFQTRYEVLESMPSHMPFGIELDQPGGGMPLTSPSECPPFHYATHYMSAAVVLHYLIRIQVSKE